MILKAHSSVLQNLVKDAIVTSQIDHQTLIDQIDSALSKTVSYFPWKASGQISQQRQVLQRVRDYLIGQQRSSAIAQTAQASAAQNQSESSVQQVMQSMIQEMNELRSTLLRPLQSEVITLTQQRNALMREVRQLEARLHSHSLEQFHDPSSLKSSQVEQLQAVHDRADQVLGTLDTTLRVVFDSLQQDINAYQDSLSQGLAKLHGLGEQGEAVFTTLVNRLVQQLGHEASDLRPQKLANSELPFQSTPTLAPLIGSAIAPGTSPTAFDPTTVSLPYPGTELPTARAKNPELLLKKPDSIHTLTDLLEQISLGTQEPLSVTPTLPTAIAQDLPSDVKSSPLPKLQSAQVSDSSAAAPTLAETTYSPEEDPLPPTYPSSEQVGLDLPLDQSVLSQLSEELSRLEREDQDGSATESSSFAPPTKIRLAGMDDLLS